MDPDQLDRSSPFDAGTAYVAATMYQFDDFRPYLYKTTDYGKTWKKITNGIPADHFTRVIREDPNKRGLLFAGTEIGIYISFDDGGNWQSFQFNLPVVPITDLAFHKRDKELVVATQGRSFWIFDDLPLLYQMADVKTATHLFQPKDSYRVTAGGGFSRGGKPTVGANPPNGAVVYYMLKDKPSSEVTLEFFDPAGKSIRKFSSKLPEKREQPGPVSAEEEAFTPRSSGSTRVPTEPGLNKFVWDLRYADATTFPGLIMWAGSTRGPLAVPGKYTVKLTADGQTQTQSFQINKNPNIPTTDQQYLSQLELELQIRDKLSKANQAVIDIRDIRKQVEDLTSRIKNPTVAERAKALSKELTDIEEAIYQTKNKAREDPLNFPIRLNNKMAALLSAVSESDDPPTSQEQMVYEDLSTGINAQLNHLNQVITKDLPAFNKVVRDQDIPAVSVKPPAGTM